MCNRCPEAQPPPVTLIKNKRWLTENRWIISYMNMNTFQRLQCFSNMEGKPLSSMQLTFSVNGSLRLDHSVLLMPNLLAAVKLGSEWALLEKKSN